MGTLFVVGTPIGNLEDLSPRARRVLGEVAIIAAEDTRLTRRLLERFEVRTPVVSFHEHSPPRRRAEILGRLEAGDVALVTDAGTPGVSDPGPPLVAEALAAGHTVVAVPGPSAVAAALSVSGLPADAYVFLGFLPRQAAQRRSLLRSLADDPRTLVAFEAPHRVVAALEDLEATLGDRTVCVARELTKLHEETWRGPLSAARARWQAVEPRGEFTLVVGGAAAGEPEAWDEGRVRTALEASRAAGLGAREASRRVAEASGWQARAVYRLWEHGA